MKAKAKAKVDVKKSNLQVDVIVPSDEFRAFVKAKKNTPISILSIDKREKEFGVGKAYDFNFNKIALGKKNIKDAILPTLQGLYAKHGYEREGAYKFCIKVGYGMVQLGYNRPNHFSWKGVLALNDGQFCCWSWLEKGLTLDKICELGNDYGLTRYRQGKNWVAHHYSVAKTAALVDYGNAIMAVVS